jgi:hypothetical protein
MRPWPCYVNKFFPSKPRWIRSVDEHFFNKVSTSPSAGHLVFANAAAALFLCMVRKIPPCGVLLRF